MATTISLATNHINFYMNFHSTIFLYFRHKNYKASFASMLVCYIALVFYSCHFLLRIYSSIYIYIRVVATLATCVFGEFQDSKLHKQPHSELVVQFPGPVLQY